MNTSTDTSPSIDDLFYAMLRELQSERMGHGSVDEMDTVSQMIVGDILSNLMIFGHSNMMVVSMPQKGVAWAEQLLAGARRPVPSTFVFAKYSRPWQSQQLAIEALCAKDIWGAPSISLWPEFADEKTPWKRTAFSMLLTNTPSPGGATDDPSLTGGPTPLTNFIEVQQYRSLSFKDLPKDQSLFPLPAAIAAQRRHLT